MNHPEKIVLFDGVCNLCNASVQFILKRDRHRQFYFASLQSETGKQLSAQFHLDSSLSRSFILIDNGKVYTHSRAALQVAKDLGGPWQLFYAFIIIPPFIRDGIYNWIAKNRYQWFGKQASWVKTPQWLQWQERFI